MLATQVQYWNYLENRRHNIATEEQAKADLAETHRGNLVKEGISRDSLSESVRHNREGEKISWGNLAEVGRHNVQQENIGFSNIEEMVRHNKEVELNYPFERDHLQMQTTTGYVNAAANAGDKIGWTPPTKAGIAALTLAGMLAGSDIGKGRKGETTYGQFSTRGTSKPKQGKGASATHYSNRPTLSDSDRNKYFRF